MDAIVLRDVEKHFKKSALRRESTTLKSELVRLLRMQKRRVLPSHLIPALRGINLRVPRGQTVGLIGRNGSGKSTLLKLVTGIYSPTRGSVEVNGRISALLDLGAGFHPDFTGRENILINAVILGMTRAEARERMDEIIAFSELGDFIDEPVRTYSSGMYMRLAFSVATHVDPDILIVDEILAVGDEHFGRKSRAKMLDFKKRGKTILLVTHDLGTLEAWCDSAAWIDGGVIREVGTPAHVVRHYRQALELAEASGASMVSPALDPSGGSLPSLAAAAPASPVEVTGVSASADEVDAEGRLEFCVEYRAQAPQAGASVAVELRREDGLVVFGTDSRQTGALLPEPLPERGVARLVLERVGLAPGRYVLAASVHAPDGSALSPTREVTFAVRSAAGTRGVVLPVHAWMMEGAAAEGALRAAES